MMDELKNMLIAAYQFYRSPVNGQWVCDTGRDDRHRVVKKCIANNAFHLFRAVEPHLNDIGLIELIADLNHIDCSFNQFSDESKKCVVALKQLSTLKSIRYQNWLQSTALMAA